MKISDVMVVSPLTVEPGTALADAARIMLDQHLSALPVVQRDGLLCGIVTDGDMLRRPELGTASAVGNWRKFLAPEASAREYVKTRGKRVDEVMTADMVTVGPDASVDEIVEMMEKRRIKQVPVVKAGKLVGLVTRRSLLGALVEKLIAVDDTMVSDQAAETMVRKAIEDGRWAPAGTIAVRVAEGVAELSGTIFSDAERRAIVVVAENTNGIREVRDRMMVIDPNAALGFATF
jgi:CBS domain-containing protein